jgi:hypothetical protein
MVALKEKNEPVGAHAGEGLLQMWQEVSFAPEFLQLFELFLLGLGHSLLHWFL